MLYNWARGSQNVLGLKEEQELFCQLKEHKDNDTNKYNELVSKIVSHNIGLVYKMAYRLCIPRMDIDDLIQQGMEGMLVAIDRYEVERDLKFATYANWWIYQKILLYQKQQSYLVRVPDYIYQERSKIMKAIGSLKADLGRHPTHREIASHLKVSIKRVTNCMARFRDHTSMDDKPYLDNDCMWHEKIADPYTNLLNEDGKTLLMSKQQRQLKRLMAKLTKIEKEIIAYMYGLVDGHSYTGADLGRMMGLSRERIRQLKAKAFKKLGIHPGKTYLDIHQKPKYWTDEDENVLAN